MNAPGPTPQRLNALRDELPAYRDRVRPAPAVEAFCRFYGIDFGARMAQVEHRAGYVHSGPFRLAVHCWLRAGAVANLLLIHGYYDHAGLFGKLARWGLDRHCNVLLFDLPGHGLSSGEPAVIDDFSDYGRAIADVLSQAELPDLPLWAMAQSTGCAALVDFARHRPWPFAAAVLLAPLVRPMGWRGVQLAYRVLGPFLDSVPRKFADNSADREFLDFVRSDPLQCHRVPLRWVGALRRWLHALERRDLGVGPVLVIQGERDFTVDWRYNVPFILSLFPGSRVEYLEDAGHQLANESGEIRGRYLEAVRAHLAEHGIDLGEAAPQV